MDTRPTIIRPIDADRTSTMTQAEAIAALELSRTHLRRLDGILRPRRDRRGQRVYDRLRVLGLAATRTAHPPRRGRPRKVRP